TVGGSQNPIVSATFSPDDRRVLLVASSKPEVWEAHTAKKITFFEGHREDVLDAVFSPDGRRILTVGRRHILWDAQTGKEVARLGAEDKPNIVSAFFSGDEIITTELGGTWTRWNGVTGQRKGVLTAPMVARKCNVSKNGLLAITFTDYDVSLWDMRSGRSLAKHRLDPKHPIYSACLAPNGTRILTTSSADHKLAQLWDARTGRLLGVLQEHFDFIMAAVFSPDSKWIVTASTDHNAGLWDAVTGRRIFMLEGHSAPVMDASFSPDSTRFLTRGADDTARVWDVETGYLLATLQGHKDSLTSAEFSHDGNYVLTASADGTAKIYDVRMSVLFEQSLAAACGMLRYQPEFEQVREYCKPLSKPISLSRLPRLSKQ